MGLIDTIYIDWKIPSYVDTVEAIYTRFRGAPWRTIPLNLNQFSYNMWAEINKFFSFYQIEAMDDYH
jgi:hypothetical protein